MKAEKPRRSTCRTCRHLGHYQDDPRPFCHFLNAFLTERSMRKTCIFHREHV